MPTYNENIPQPGDNPSNSQPLILQNFQSIGDPTTGWVAQDHYNFASTDYGQHQQVSLPATRAIDPVPIGTASMLYSKTVSGLAELFFKNSAKLDQLTGLPLVTSGTNYGIETPWGLTFNFGRSTGTPGGVTISFAIPFTTAVYSVTTGQDQNNGVLKAQGVSLTQVTFVYTNAGGTGVWYLAIGK